jgi:starch phosphorylase
LFASKESLKRAILDKLQTMQGKCLEEAAPIDFYRALGGVVRDYIGRSWVKTETYYRKKGVKQVYYFSMEFLVGRLLGSNLLNLGVWELCRQVLAELGMELEELEELEPDAGLGNGGLGRLAACFLDSLASLELPGHGCGIRYKYGHFEQKIIGGYQVEVPDNWLREGNIWEFRRGDRAQVVRFGGTVRAENVNGRLIFIHEDYDLVLAVPYDTPVIGYQNMTVNTLRLWNAETGGREFHFPSFSHLDYQKAINYKYDTEAISEILYPDDSNYQGRVLRLKQQYFLVSAGVQGIVASHKKRYGTLDNFSDKVVIHVNDTHPVLAIPELMRTLMDEEGMGWDQAWQITTGTISYTNHTILAEALEKWPVEMFKSLLPRIFLIVEEINQRFCRELWNKYPGDWDRIGRMAIIADGYVKMAHLAIVGSRSVNGVAKIHTEILKKQEMNNFYQVYPHKFNNKTNGITHRRWLIKANPLLAGLITDAIGNSWIKHPTDLLALRRFAEDPSFQEKSGRIKQQNKLALVKLIREETGLRVDISSIFDVQIKRLHGYKRQLLNALHIMHLYNRLLEEPDWEMFPRTFVFGAKAAPSYHQAKLTIKLINTIAQRINNDKTIKDKLKVIFIPNYRVSLAEKIIAAAEVSQQISTAGKEASGTGNMKLMMNGAVTVGTMDGANIEIRDEVGHDNMITFGLKENQVLDYYHYGGYCSWHIYHQDERVKKVLDQLVNGFLPASQGEFRNLFASLLHNNDEFFVLKDFHEYALAHLRVDRLYRERQHWQKMSTINIACSGRFSSDRTIAEYAAGIWQVEPAAIEE